MRITEGQIGEWMAAAIDRDRLIPFTETGSPIEVDFSWEIKRFVLTNCAHRIRSHRGGAAWALCFLSPSPVRKIKRLPLRGYSDGGGNQACPGRGRLG